MTARILIIAGSDSGGGAGIQADIKTVTMLGGHAMTAITAVTAQNTLGVSAVHPIPTDIVIAQIDAVLSDIGADAIKIGMISSAETANAVAERLEGLDIPIIFDPVIIATSGSVLADADTITAFEKLMRIAALTTPNTHELAALSGLEIESELDVATAASNLIERTRCPAVLAKGGHFVLSGETYGTTADGNEFRYENESRVFDFLFEENEQGWRERSWEGERIETTSTHGTGCTLASAIATGLGQGMSLGDAIGRARQFVRLALRDAPGLGGGHGPMGHQAVREDALTPGFSLNQVTVGCSDYPASVAFYRTLGFRQIVDSPSNGYARFEAPNGTTLSIHKSEAAAVGTVVYLEHSQLDAWTAQLMRNGLTFDQLPQDEDWFWREARLRDPHGNVICLYQAGENRRYPPWRI